MREVVINSRIIVADPPPGLTAWCASELSLINPNYAKKLRMGFWVGNTPKTLELYEIRGNRLILPYGTLPHIMPFVVDTHEVRHTFAKWPYIDFKGENIGLYPYQEKAVQALTKAKFGILQSPAGSGKTQMGIELIKRFNLPALWLTHTTDLLLQSMQRARRYMDHSLIGTITAGKVNIGKGVTFATVQTMANLNLEDFRNEWAVVICDECHHAASTPTTVTRFGKVLNALAAPYKFGLSATLHRSDGLIKSVFSLIGDIAYTVPPEAVEEKTMKVRVIPIQTACEMTEDCLKPDGTLDYWGLINVLCNDLPRNRQIIDLLTEHRMKPSLILSERLDHLSLLMDMLPENMRSKACMVTGKTKKDVRDRALDEMRKGEKQYLFATYVLAKEGLDIPRLEALYMATPAKDEAVVIQSVGRVSRTCEDKGEPVVFDLVDPIRYCKRSYKERLKYYKRLGAYFEGGTL